MSNHTNSNTMIRLLVTIDTSSGDMSNGNKSLHSQKNFMLPINQSGNVKNLLSKIQKSSPDGFICQSISLNLPSGELFEVSNDYQVSESFKDMDKVWVKAIQTNKQVSKVQVKKVDTPKKEEQKNLENNDQAVDPTVNKNKARRLRKQMEKQKQKQQDRENTAEAAKAIANEKTQKSGSVKKDMVQAQQSPAQIQQKQENKSPQKGNQNSNPKTPVKQNPQISQIKQSNEKPKQEQQTPKLGKNALKKQKRKEQVESAEKLRNEIYNGINNYSQEEALKSVSEAEDSKKGSQSLANSENEGLTPTQSFLQQLKKISQKIKSDSSSSGSSSFGSVGK